MKTHDLTGERFGDLKVLWRHKLSNNGGASWVCKCSCGFIDIVPGNKLVNGTKTHCSNCHRGRFEFNKDNTVKCILPDGSGFTFDFDDFSVVSRHRWSRTKSGYYKASLGSRKAGHIILHRLIMKPPDNMVVDHIDGNTDNNCRSNLRICTAAENSYNTKMKSRNKNGYKGVSFDPRRGKWYARIRRGTNIYLGMYDSASEAAAAYDAAAVFLHGPYAKTNKMIREGR